MSDEIGSSHGHGAIEPAADAIEARLRELAELARRKPDEIGEHLAGLSLREQAELALRLPPRERLEVLLHAPRPMRLVRTLPHVEFYLTVRGGSWLDDARACRSAYRYRAMSRTPNRPVGMRVVCQIEE